MDVPFEKVCAVELKQERVLVLPYHLQLIIELVSLLLVKRIDLLDSEGNVELFVDGDAYQSTVSLPENGPVL